MINYNDFIKRTKEELFGPGMKPKQIEGCCAILREYERREVGDAREAAYALATAYWETDTTIEPIREYGLGAGREYGVPAGPYDHIYYGRGLVQLTWLENYQRMGAEVGRDLVQYPDQAMELPIAVAILWCGMLKGLFTGKRLSDYFYDGTASWEGARWIVNGQDRAQEIADLGRIFYYCLGGPRFVRLLQLGARGRDVLKLQSALRARSMYGGILDGDFGPGTRAAVVSFQKREGLVPDGIVGMLTRTRLSL